MPEPPLKVEPDAVQLEPRKTGLNVLDLVITGAAILISLISLAVAIEHGRSQEKLVTAATWPFVQLYTSDVGGAEEDRRVIAMGLKNSGVGPAKIESVQMTWKGREVASSLEFLRACCGVASREPRYGHGLQSNTVSPGVLIAGQSASFLVMPWRPETAPVWDALDRARSEASLSICYCSVFDECWVTDGNTLRPKPVKACPKDTPPFAR